MQQKNNTTAIIIIASLFFIFGFVTWINGALIPFMKTINEYHPKDSVLLLQGAGDIKNIINIIKDNDC